MSIEACQEVDCFMQGLVRRNPGENEFHQAVREVVEHSCPMCWRIPSINRHKSWNA